MLRAMFSAISGMQAHQTMLDVVANDIANVNTVGYKSENTNFQDALSELTKGAGAPTTQAGGTNAIQIGLGVTLGSVENEMGTGATQQTGNALDLAIQGDGFFRVASTAGVIGSGTGYSYTRAGNFSTDSAGNLVTQDGGFVVGYKYDAGTNSFPMTQANETQITVPATASDVTIGSDGVVSYVDATGTTQKLAQISLAKFPNDSGLERISGNLFAASNNSGTPVNAVPDDAASGMGSLDPGALEMSNVDLANEFTEMITAQRGYEANSRVISVADQVLQNLVQLGQ
jgi:flagellar hook protein FlgE